MEVSDQGVRDRDTQRKQSGKDYADKRFHTRDRNVREGDNVLLEKKKENKLSREGTVSSDISLCGPGGVAITRRRSVQMQPSAY